MLAKILKKLGIEKIERDPLPIEKEKEKEIPEIIIDTGEDIFAIWPSRMARNEATNDFVHVGCHKVYGCWGRLLIYNLERYKALCCNICNLRIKIPVEITTAEELKIFLEMKKEI